MLNENASEIDFLFTSKMSNGNIKISFIYSGWIEYVYRTQVLTSYAQCLIINTFICTSYTILPYSTSMK